MKTHPVEHRNKRTCELLVSSFILVAIITGLTGCETLPDTAVQTIRLGLDDYNRQQYTKSITRLNPVIQKYPETPGTAEALYIRGLAQLQQRKRNEARRDFQDALELSNRKDLTAWLQVQLANMSFDDQQYASAAKRYALAREELPDKSPTDRILFQYARALMRAGDFVQSRFILGELLAVYPSSSYAVSARRLYRWPHAYFSIQCGAFTSSHTAAGVLKEVRNKGYAAQQERELRDGRTLHVVRLGQYPNWNKAEVGLRKIQRDYPDAFIVP